MTKKILIIGDMHVGSDVAIMPAEIQSLKTERENSQLIKASPVQLKILDKWHEMIDNEGKVDGIILNGDLVEGYNKKNNGLGTWSCDMDTQARAAKMLIQEIKYKKLYGTQGSLYHTNNNISVDKLVVEGLGGTFSHDLALKCDSVRIHASHKVGVSGSTWQYRTTPIARELVMSELNSMEFGKFNIVVRSHTHYYCAVQFGSSLGIICPCWKGRDEYVRLLGMSYSPSIGYVILEIDGKNYTWRHNIMHLRGNDIMMEHNVTIEDL